MEISLPLLLDGSGFLRRECPSCESEFKWFYGDVEGKPDEFLDPENYFCPYCGVSADKGSWWTRAQLDYVESVAMEAVAEEIKDGLSGAGLKFSANDSIESSDPPFDPDDMVMVEPPCHPFEPLKVLEDRLGQIHCLLCGQVFTV